MTGKTTSRIETLDWLRGLMALSIMFYHLTMWIVSPQDSSTIIGRLGVYGVSIFFVLSGLSMAIVYNRFINSVNSSIKFFVRRIFRIIPLMIVATTLVVLPEILASGKTDWWNYFINITTLFGFIKPTSYIPVGAWSIGNEMVYYAFTPFIIFLYNYRRLAGNIFFILSVVVGMYFAFWLMTPDIKLSEQWALYVNPFNNFFLYIAGIAIYYNFRDIKIGQAYNIAILIVCVLLFCFLPYNGNQITVVSGHGRVVFVILSFFIVFCFYKLRINLPVIFSRSLETFGIATYGVYLLHPIMLRYITDMLNKFKINNTILLYMLVMVFTIVIAVISYRWFELKLIKSGKKMTS